MSIIDQHIVNMIKTPSLQSDDEYILDCNEYTFNELVKTLRFGGNENTYKNRIAIHHSSLVELKPKKMLWSTFYWHIQNAISSLAPLPRLFIYDDMIRNQLKRVVRK